MTGRVSYRGIFFRLLGFLRPYKGALRISVVLAVGSQLCQIALVFDPKASLLPGAVLALTVTKAKVIPEDIGAVDDDPYFLDKKLNLADIQLNVGTVVVN